MKSHRLEYVSHPVEHGTKWQKHVMVVLWISLLVVVVFSAVLLYGQAHGLFHSSPNILAPGWPADP